MPSPTPSASAPTGLSYTENLTLNRITLSFTRSSAAPAHTDRYFEVRRGGTLIATVGTYDAAGTYTYTDTTPGGARPITYKVRTKLVPASGDSTYTGTSFSSDAVLTTDSPPYASVWNTADGQTVDNSSSSTISFLYDDPDGDPMASYQLRYSTDGGATWTTTTTTLVAVDLASVVITIPSGRVGDYIYQVLPHDNAGNDARAWSPSLHVTYEAPPATPTITSPSAGDTIGSLALSPLDWATVSGQVAYQARRLNGSTVIEDSGKRSKSQSFHRFSASSDYTGSETWEVRVWTDQIASAYATVAVTLFLNPPPVPVVTATQVSSGGRLYPAVTVAINNGTPGAGESAAVSNTLTRTGPDGTVVIADGLAPGATFVDLTPAAGVNAYRVTAVSSVGTTSTSA